MYVLEVKRHDRYFGFFGPFMNTLDAHQWAMDKGIIPIDYIIHRIERPK